MHVLLTNDDGIQSVGLESLAQACLQRGHEVTISAPATQQSAASQRITIDAPLLVREVPWKGAKAYAVEGSPADCARLGPRLAEKPIDFVFSGINNGENAGCAVFYSGTVAAAREARMCGYQSMAVSIDVGSTEPMRMKLARMAVEIAEKLQPLDWPRMRMLNLNAPSLPPEAWKDLRICPLSDAYFKDQYDRRVSPRGQVYFWLGAGMEMEPHRKGTDLDLLEKGHVTLSLLGGWQDDAAWLENVF